MPLVAAYYRPSSLDEALSLLAKENRIPLAGGTTLNADREHSAVEVVDLQALELDQIHPEGDRLHVGATVTLDQLSTTDGVPQLISQLAKSEAPSTLRTLATVGGTIAGGTAANGSGDSALLAALLVHDAQVGMAGATDAPLQEVLATGVPTGAIITDISIDPTGEGSAVSTGRTPADVPIVAAVARMTGAGPVLALTGVAPNPVLVDPADPTAGLTPNGDFRGSASYRTELAKVLSARALEAVK